METSYIDRILEQAGMKTCKAAPTPGTDALKKGKAELAEALSPEEHQQYRKLVGQLLWLCNLRMDIMYAVKELSRGLAAPTTHHSAKLKHLLRCLTGAKNYVQELCPKIRLSEKHSSLDVHTYVDSDWAGDPDTRRSTSGVATYLLGVNLQSHSRAQQTIALSSGEAELYAVGAGAADSLFIRPLLLEACLIPKVHLFIHTDSAAGESMASRYGTSRKTRHVQLRYLFVQELVTSGMITIRKVLGTLNNAIYLLSMSTKKLWQGMFPLLALGLVVSSKSVVLEYVHKTLYMLFSLSPHLYLFSYPERNLGSPNAKRFCMSQTFTVFQLEKLFAVMLGTCLCIDLRSSGL